MALLQILCQLCSIAPILCSTSAPPRRSVRESVKDLCTEVLEKTSGPHKPFCPTTAGGCSAPEEAAKAEGGKGVAGPLEGRSEENTGAGEEAGGWPGSWKGLCVDGHMTSSVFSLFEQPAELLGAVPLQVVAVWVLIRVMSNNACGDVGGMGWWQQGSGAPPLAVVAMDSSTARGLLGDEEASESVRRRAVEGMGEGEAEREGVCLLTNIAKLACRWFKQGCHPQVLEEILRSCRKCIAPRSWNFVTPCEIHVKSRIDVSSSMEWYRLLFGLCVDVIDSAIADAPVVVQAGKLMTTLWQTCPFPTALPSASSSNCWNALSAAAKRHPNNPRVNRAVMLFGLSAYPTVTTSSQADIPSLEEPTPSDWLPLVFACLENCEDAEERMVSVQGLHLSTLPLLCRMTTSHVDVYEQYHLRLWETVVLLLQDELPQIREACAEVCGSALAHWREFTEEGNALRSLLDLASSCSYMEPITCIELLFSIIPLTFSEDLVSLWLKKCLDNCNTNVRQICKDKLGVALPLRMTSCYYTPYWHFNFGLKREVTPRKIFDEEAANPCGESLLIAQLAVRSAVSYFLQIPVASPLFTPDLARHRCALTVSDSELERRGAPWLDGFWLKTVSQQLADCCLALQSLTLKELTQGTSSLTWSDYCVGEATAGDVLGHCTHHEYLFPAMACLLLKLSVILAALSVSFPSRLTDTQTDLLDELRRLLCRFNDLLVSQLFSRSPHKIILEASYALSTAWNLMSCGEAVVGREPGDKASLHKAVSACIFAVHSAMGG
eukprot:GHVQ01024058.1.p1 GENE.GHVQ01024058.1~~GHVQ01024058.1.p1  ORF type:complete len:825 (-),score=99.46 GHVQ01024058.1:1846-4176(-)